MKIKIAIVFAPMLVFRPNAEIGLGDDLVLVALNLEFAYKIPLAGKPWAAYVGAGPALNIYSFSNDHGRGRDRGRGWVQYSGRR